LIPLALATWAIVALVVFGVLVVIAAPLRLLWRLRQGDVEPAGTDSAAWRRRKKDKPEDYD
jgi:cytochrome b561